MQRGPDEGGIGYWTNQVQDPANSRAGVCNAFEASSEFATIVSTLYGTAASDNERTEHFVNTFYLGAYGRSATTTELQTQRDALNAAAGQGQSQVQAQAETFGRSLFADQVNDAAISNTQYVTNLYEAFLQRGPDAGGLGYWSALATLGVGRQNVLNAFAACGAFNELTSTLYREAFWLVNDQLGTPRMITNKSGSLAGVKRHDYLPFGEEIGGPQVALLGARTATSAFSGDSVRQHFTGYEADGETGLNYAQARYQSPVQGRFTSVDPLGASASVANPQSFNRYSYVNNNPTNLTDPSGMAPYGAEHSYSDVAEGFWGNSVDLNRSHFGGPAVLFAAGLFRDIGVMAAMQPGSISSAGDGKVDGAAGETSANGEASPPPVTFLTAQLLSNDNDPKILRAANFEPTGYGTDNAILDVETADGPNALGGDVFTVRVTFQLPEYTKAFATGTADPGSKIIIGKDNRYRFPTMKEAPFGSSYAFHDDGNRRGHVDISLKVRDIEAENRNVLVRVNGAYQNGSFFSGQASLTIVGKNETPRKRLR